MTSTPSSPGPLWLGIDAGSISLDAVLLDCSGEVVKSAVVITRGRTVDALVEALFELADGVPEAIVAQTCITGSGRSMLAGLVEGAGTVNEITAHATGTGPLLPRGVTCSLLEIGGQDSKFMTLTARGADVEVLDYAMNTLCAAGTGTFFEGQAERLKLSVEELSRLAASADRPAEVAGRCVVFAKTDIIHHQQKGTPIDELALGLCHAAARNIFGTLIRGRPVHRPLYFTGGVAANQGMVRALHEVLGLDAGQPVVPPSHRILGAVGAATRALEMVLRPTRVTPLVDMARRARSHAHRADGPGNGEVSAPALVHRPLATSRKEPARHRKPSPAGADCLALGFDLGSVSVKWAIVEGSEITDSYYAFTRGKPVDAVAEALERLRERACGPLRSVGVTGSGRKLAARLIGADLAINEITAHATAMRMLDPDVDTLFEIGGQDAKYVRLDRGSVLDFALNTACSAGTGSLLIEEAVRIGLDVQELDDVAELSVSPAELHDRCTVFIDSDLVSRMQRGTPVPDLAAGLLFAVARNYVERVLAGRTPGDRIVFAGGVSRSRVVTREIGRLLGRDVTASPWGALSGAIGAAIIARERTAPGVRHDPAAMVVPAGARSTRVVRCKGCGASCSVTRLDLDSGDPAHGALRLFMGDACGRWSDRTDTGPDPDEPRKVPPDDIFEARARLYRMDRSVPALEKGRCGVPRAQQMWDHYPLLRTLAEELGIEVGLSAPTTPSSIQRGIALSRSEQCMPVKVAMAHCDDLLDRGASALLVPSLGEYPHDPTLERSEMDRLLNCIYTIQLGSVVRATLGDKAAKLGVPILVPSISLNPDLEGYTVRSIVEAFAPLGSFSRRRVRNAFRLALAHHAKLRARSESLGVEALRAATRDHPAVVVFGRPYTLYDPVLNIQLAERLRRLGLVPVPYDTILSAGVVPPHLSFMQWKVGSDHIKAVQALASFAHAYPMFLTYYGCGPDAFISKYFEEILGDRPALSVELDGHSAEAGLETRLEAFADAISQGSRDREGCAAAPLPGPKASPIRLARDPALLRGRVIALSDFHDLAHAFAGAFERAGMEARIMPMATEETRRLGEKHSNGRECNPYTIILGDLVSWALDPSVPNDRKGFFITSARGPCLLTHYATGFSRVMRKMGAGDLVIWNPTGKELETVLSLGESVALWQGIIATNYLYRWGVALHPYEKTPGSVLEAKTRALELVRRGMREIEVHEHIAQAVEIMRSVPTTRYEPGARAARIKVGVVGDLYTRSHSFANQDLYGTLESLGCEVLAPPFVLDGQLYDLWDHPIQHLTHGRYASAVKRGLLSAYQLEEVWRIRRLFPDDPEITFDGTGISWRRDTSRYFNSDVDGYLAQNLGKALDHIHAGAEGIVNVMCHNCMVGLASDAVISDIRRDHGDIPYLSLAYDSLGDVHIRTRIEAFVDMLRSRRPATKRT